MQVAHSGSIGRLVDEGSFAFDARMVGCLEAWPSGFDAAP